jgi:hypothetical protein
MHSPRIVVPEELELPPLEELVDVPELPEDPDAEPLLPEDPDPEPLLPEVTLHEGALLEHPHAMEPARTRRDTRRRGLIDA